MIFRERHRPQWRDPQQGRYVGLCLEAGPAQLLVQAHTQARHHVQVPCKKNMSRDGSHRHNFDENLLILSAVESQSQVFC
jgi:hypothetical protein